MTGHSDWLGGDGGSAMDFFRSGAGGLLPPDGANDITEAIRRDGGIGLRVDPVSLFDVNGTLGLGVFATGAAAVSLVGVDAVVVRLTSATAQAVTLPAAGLVPRRIYWLVNAAAAAKTVTAYQSLSGVAKTLIAANSSLLLISDGANWNELLTGLPAPSEVVQLVPLNTPVALDNIRLEPRLVGGVGFRMATVAGTATVSISAVTSFGTNSVRSSNRPSVALTTALVHPFAWAGQSDGDGMTGQIYDKTAGRYYEFTIQTHAAPALSLVKIKRIY